MTDRKRTPGGPRRPLRAGWLALGASLLLATGLLAPTGEAACCYFAALDKDVDQPGQKAFLTWDPERNEESFTVQAKFEGDARDFGMVIPTPSRPSLDEMPREFFRHLAVYTILLPQPKRVWPPRPVARYRRMAKSAPSAVDFSEGMEVESLGVRVLEAGIVGSLDYKILEASNARGLFQWLDQNQYSYAGGTDTLDHYIRKGWNFTVMKIDTAQMKKGPDGNFLGEVTPTRFTFESKELVYPLKITQRSVKDRTEAIFYVQAPEQMDLKGDWSWLWSYRVMWLNSGTVCISQKSMTPEERQELQDRNQHVYEMKRKLPGYDTTKLDWAHRLDEGDLELLDDPEAFYGQYHYPDLPEGARVVTLEEYRQEIEQSGSMWQKMGRRLGMSGVPTKGLDRLAERYPPSKGHFVRKLEGDRPVLWFFPHREAPPEEVRALGQLKGHLRPGFFLTKFRKTFRKQEMTQDLELVPVPRKLETEYLRILPQSPP